MGLVQREGDISETLREILKLYPCCIQDFKIFVFEGKFTTEVKEFPPLPSLFPSLETAYLIAVAGDITWLIPALSGLHEMSSFKTLVCLRMKKEMECSFYQ